MTLTIYGYRRKRPVYLQMLGCSCSRFFGNWFFPNVNNDEITDSNKAIELAIKECQSSEDAQKQKLQKELTALLDKHEVNDPNGRAKVFGLLDIMLDHDCNYLVRDLDHGKDIQKVTDRSKISHHLRLKTRQTCFYYGNNYKDISCHVKGKSETKITLKAKTTSCPYENYVCRHMVQIPIISTLLKIDDICLPPEIAAEINIFVNAENEIEFEYLGLCYPCLTNDTMSVDSNGDFQESKDDADNDEKTYNLYKQYLSNEQGDITFTIDSKEEPGTYQHRAFHAYYGKFIESYNKALTEYLEENKFYFISVMKSKIKTIEKPSIKHYLVLHDSNNGSHSDSMYCLEAQFSGFNNLNMKCAASNENTVVRSTEFEINLIDYKWNSKHFCDVEFDLSPSKGSYLVCVDRFREFVNDKAAVRTWTHLIRDTIIHLDDKITI